MNDLWSKTELKLYAMRKSKDGIIISFVLHPDDVSQSLMRAPIGTCYLAALVEKLEEESEEADTKLKKGPLAREAVMACNKAAFVVFLHETHPHINGVNSAEKVRTICGVKSRREFDTDPAKGRLWEQLHGKYLGWCRQ
jgi:hypothetical protein